jgi:hypothetical protein
VQNPSLPTSITHKGLSFKGPKGRGRFYCRSQSNDVSVMYIYICLVGHASCNTYVRRVWAERGALCVLKYAGLSIFRRSHDWTWRSGHQTIAERAIRAQLAMRSGVYCLQPRCCNETGSSTNRREGNSLVAERLAACHGGFWSTKHYLAVPYLRRLVAGCPGSSPGQVMWDLWWTKRHWGRFRFLCQFSLHRVLRSHHPSSGADAMCQTVGVVPSVLSLTARQLIKRNNC